MVAGCSNSGASRALQSFSCPSRGFDQIPATELANHWEDVTSSSSASALGVRLLPAARTFRPINADSGLMSVATVTVTTHTSGELQGRLVMRRAGLSARLTDE